MPRRGGPLRGIVTPSKRACTRRENATEEVDEGEEEKVVEMEAEAAVVLGKSGR